MDDLTRQLGENLRRLRAERGHSLDDLAILTGVSKSMLRQIELGESSPSISTVWKIAKGLRLSFTTLVAEPQESHSVVGFRSREALRDLDPGYRVHPVLDWKADRGFEAYYVEIDSGAGLEAEGHGPGASEHIFVQAGRLQVRAGKEELEGGPEEALSFEASASHGYRNPGPLQVRAIMVIHYPSG